MKICYFADAGSIHIVRWCKYFSLRGHDVHLISFNNSIIEGVQTHFVDAGEIMVKGGNWRVLLKYKKVKELLKLIKPDIFHAHYATSYGITGALCGFHPYVITTLGTDVLISAKQSDIYRLLLRYAFRKADWINTLAPHMSMAVKDIGADMKKVEVVPFGIDTDIFNDNNRKKKNEKFTITSTRNHELVYNIPHLIKAVSKIKTLIPELEFIIAGDGSLRNDMERLVEKEGLKDVTTFTGRISQSEMVNILNSTDIFVTVSKSDGNSLSLAEAMACGAFCIVTDIPANSQWIQNNENGFLVSVDDVNALADKLLSAYNNFDFYQNKAVKLNHKIIEEKGIWKKNMLIIENKYNKLLSEWK